MSTTVRWTVEALRKLEEVFPDSRMELIEGELYNKMGQKPPHAYVVNALMNALIGLFGPAYVRVQLPVTLTTEDSRDSEPEPDLAVTKRDFSQYRLEHPTPDEIVLLVEVADTSKKVDLSVKVSLYARNGIAEYWVADVQDRALYVFTAPAATGYDRMRRLRADDVMPGSAKPVASLFPPETTDKL